MCIDLPGLRTSVGLTFSQLSDVQTVGIGLYLALAVIQAVSGTGVAGLARRLTALRATVSNARLGTAEAASVRSLFGQIGGLDIGFQALNRRILKVIVALFTLALVYFLYCTIEQDRYAGVDGLVFIVLYYVLLPMIMFLGYSFYVYRKCAAASQMIRQAEIRIQGKVLNRTAG